MKNQRILKKAAKKTMSWLLILGMMVTLPQLPADIVYAAQVQETSIDTEESEADSEKAETETETAETKEETKKADSEAAEMNEESAEEQEEIAVSETNIKAEAVSTNLTIHFKNEQNWDNVYAKFGAGESWNAISGLEYCTSNEFGGLINKNSKNTGWYSFKITKSDTETINGLFNKGEWGSGNQTENYKVEITADTMEVWITGNTVSSTAPDGWETGAEATAPVNPATVSKVKSPVLNQDGSVTFNYEISADKLGSDKLYLMGTLTDWNQGKEMTDEDKDGIYSITISEKSAGTYEYKFKYGGNWKTDPVNSRYSNGNSAVTIPGLEEKTIEAVLGETTILPDNLKLYTADGSVSDAAVTYRMDTPVNGVTLNGKELNVSDAVTETSFALVATYQDKTSKVWVDVVAEQYQYHIYYYADHPDRVTADSAALWLYGKNVDGTLHEFTDAEEINGYTWLKGSWTTSLQEISIIARSPEDWSWQAATVNYVNSKKEKEVNIYIIHGNTTAYTELPDIAEVNQKYYILVEYKRADNNYDGWNIYTWDNGYDNTYTFTDCGKSKVAAVRVAPGRENITFCMRHSTAENEWESKDGGDHIVWMTPGQYVTKVVFEEEKGIVSYYPDNMGYELKDGKVNFYYRDDEKFMESKAESFSSVKVVYDNKTYDMSYNAANQRWEKTDLDVTEGKHRYAYQLTADEGEQFVLDSFNEKKEAVEGQEYSVFDYYQFNASVSSVFAQSKMDYADNNVLKVTVSANQSAGGTTFTATDVSVDLTAVGGSAQFKIKPELMEGTIAVKEGTAAGTYEIPVTVTDQYGNTYNSLSSLEVTAREKGEDFDWDEAVIYFAVTDRFYDGNTANNDAYGTGDYNKDAATGSLSYHGGDFAGLTKKLDYLSQLGVNTIWITPIVANEMKEGLNTELAGTLSYGYHGYWASDFTTLNKHLGTEEEFKTLLDSAHAKGMKVMVDVVLNHAGYGTENYFNSKVEGKDMIRSGENLVVGDTKKGPLADLPDFMTEDKDVRNLLVEWQSSWISKYDIDYYRVDTVKHVDDVTWAAFKNALTKINPDFKMIGEYSGAGYCTDTRTLDSGEMDSLLDFDFNDQALAFVQGNIDKVESFMEARDAAIDNTATLGAFTGSHDEDGLMSKIIDAGYTEEQAYRMFMAAATLQMTSKGQVVIYYGEEIGQYGKDNYPYQTNRYDFNWSKAQLADGSLNTSDPMLAHYQKLLAVRSDYSEILAKGERSKIAGGDDAGYLVFCKTYQDKNVYVGINLKDEAVTVNNLAVSGSGYTDRYGAAAVTEAADGTISFTIPPLSQGGTIILAVEETVEETVTPVKKVYVTPSLCLKKGKTAKLQATVFPKDASEELIWSSSNKKVASVSQNGKVKALKAGKATITVKTSGGKKASCKITVVKKNKKASDIKLNKAKLTLKKGGYTQLKATITKNATDKITWKSSNKKVAVVDHNGVVTGIKKGTATITAKTSGGKKATCKVTVKAAKTNVKVTLNKTKVTLKKGKNITLKATVTPDGTKEKLTWSSSNKKVASVTKKGKVKAIQKGKATITVKTTSGKKATCKVTVK